MTTPRLASLRGQTEVLGTETRKTLAVREEPGNETTGFEHFQAF